MRRKIVRIDESKCNGCGLCVSACHEGAIQMVDGKAMLVSDVYCDGLGDCVGECPQDAITIEEREAEAYDEAAVKTRMREKPPAGKPSFTLHSGGGCPGKAIRSLRPSSSTGKAGQEGPVLSRLGNWPVKIQLAPPTAPYFEDARLLVAADCTAYAFGDFHREFIDGRVLLTGCPKFGDSALYLDRLTAIFRENDIRDVEVVYMEVPCCLGLAHLVQRAVQASGKEIPLTLAKLSLDGKLLERVEAKEAAAPGR